MRIFIYTYKYKIQITTCVLYVVAIMVMGKTLLLKQAALYRLSQLFKPKWSIAVTSYLARWHLNSPASLLFTQPFIQEEIKEDIKALRHWPLCGEFTGDRWILRTYGQ